MLSRKSKVLLWNTYLLSGLATGSDGLATQSRRHLNSGEVRGHVCAALAMLLVFPDSMHNRYGVCSTHLFAIVSRRYFHKCTERHISGAARFSAAEQVG